MSEVTGPPQFKGLEPVIRVPGISKNDQKPDDQKPPHDQEQQQVKQKDPTAHLSRDPAVSLSASVGHIALGEDISGSILSIDPDGRPLLITNEATFALTPDVGLKAGDSITLNIVTTDHKLIAELTFRNGKPEIPPVLLSLTLVSVKQVPNGEITTPVSDTRYIDSQTGAYIPPTTAPLINKLAPQTSLSSGIYQRSAAPEVGVVSEPASPDSSQKSAPLSPVDQAILKDKVAVEIGQLNDPTIIKASTTDMAAMLIAQQMSGPAPSPTLQVKTKPANQSAAVKASVVAEENVRQSPVATGHSDGASKLSQPDKSVNLDRNVTPSHPLVQTPSVYPSDSREKASPDLTDKNSQVPLQTLPTAKSVIEQAATEENSTLKYAQIEPQIPPLSPPPPATPDTRKVPPASRPVLSAEFKPSDVGQAFLTKANINTSKPSVRVEVILRAKQKNDPPNTIEVKILSVREKPGMAISQTNNPTEQRDEKLSQNPSEAPIAQSNLTNESNQHSRTIQIETTGGTVEIALPNSQPLPLPESYMAIIPAAFTPSPILQTSPSTASNVVPLSLLTKGFKKWPALQRTHELISQEQQKGAIVPSFIQQITNALTSRTAGGGARLTNSLLFMMAALRQGDASSWLGPKVEQYLEHKGQKHLLNILKQDITRIASLINRPASGEWQPIVLPLAADDNSPLLALLIRPEQPNQKENNQGTDGQDNDSKENPTRFILEVHLSQLGNIQLDGFIKEKNFGLKFKSLVPLPQEMKNEIRELFSNALDVSGYSGSITFYDLPIFPINVTDIINKAEPLTHEIRNA